MYFLLTLFLWAMGLFIAYNAAKWLIVTLLTRGDISEEEMWAREHGQPVLASGPNWIERIRMDRKRQQAISRRGRRTAF